MSYSSLKPKKKFLVNEILRILKLNQFITMQNHIYGGDHVGALLAGAPVDNRLPYPEKQVKKTKDCRLNNRVKVARIAGK